VKAPSGKRSRIRDLLTARRALVPEGTSTIRFSPHVQPVLRSIITLGGSRILW